MQSLILDVEEVDSSYSLARPASVVDALIWTGLAVKKIKSKWMGWCGLD
jgi:hypothetical protein